MDPSHASADDETASMAEAMGFASFGTQTHPSKRRKFNAATDAFVEGQELARLDKGGKKGQGSGGNNVPLGKARVFGTNQNTNLDEIDLDEEDGVGLADQPGDGDQDDAEGPHYIDTSEPPPLEQERDKQERIDRLLANIQAEAESYPTSHHLPQRPASASNNAVNPRSNQRTGGRGQHNELWYLGYYDPSFNANPWTKLEKERGLQPVGTWLELPGR